MKIHEENSDTIKLIADNIYYVDICVKQKTKEGQSVSGDTVIYFESPDNKDCPSWK